MPNLKKLGASFLVVCIAVGLAHAQSFYREHCLFVKNGYLKSESSKPSRLLKDYDLYGQGKPLVIHFHGGLVSEANGKQEALDLDRSCYGRVSYPIFFIWNADFFTELNNLLQARYGNLAFRQGHVSTAQFLEQLFNRARENKLDLNRLKTDASALLAQYRLFMKKNEQFQRAVSTQTQKETPEDWTHLDTWLRAKDRLENGITNYFSQYVEAVVRYHDERSVSWGGDLLEWISYNLGGQQIWGRMKRDTALSFASRQGIPGAGLQLLGALKSEKHLPRIVLVGHSTGCIYIVNFLKAAKKILPGVKFDVVFLAPANTYHEMAEFLVADRDTIRNFRMFGIRDTQERRDHMFWELNPELSGLYPGSLLIYVSRAVEARHNTPILGLQRDYLVSDTPQDQHDRLFVRRVLLDRPGAVVWSPTNGRVGYCTDCISHGDFCSDGETLASLKFLVASPNW